METTPQVPTSRTTQRLWSSLSLAAGFFLLSLASSPLHAQDWVRTGTNLGVEKIRLAAADFKPASADPQTPGLKTTFDTTLFDDLTNAGIFDMVSKSLAPPATPGTPQEANLVAWSSPPANAAMLALGS